MGSIRFLQLIALTNRGIPRQRFEVPPPKPVVDDPAGSLQAARRDDRRGGYMSGRTPPLHLLAVVQLTMTLFADPEKIIDWLMKNPLVGQMSNFFAIRTPANLALTLRAHAYSTRQCPPSRRLAITLIFRVRLTIVLRRGSWNVRGHGAS
jgi:hypothetical protein